MYKFALTGVHGSGKTTLLSKIARELSRREISCVRINDVGETCQLQIGANTSFDAQVWIFAEQMQQEIIATTYDAQVVLCDRTLLDAVMYLRRLTDIENREYAHVKTMKSMHRLSMSWMSTYDYVARLKINLPWLLERDKDKGTVEELTDFANVIESWFDYWADDYVDATYYDVPTARHMAYLIEAGLHDETTRHD